MNLFELFVKIGVDDSEFNKGIGKARSGFGDFSAWTVAKGQLIADAIKTGSKALIDFGKQSIESYAEYEQLVGGVETLFGAGGKSLEEYAASMGKSIEEVENKYWDLRQANNEVLHNADKAFQTAGLSANQYMETVTSFSASLIQSLGGDTIKAAEYADMAIIDMADNANKMGTSIDMIQNAYQGFAKQNYTMLDNLKLGYGGTQTEMYRLLQDAQRLDETFDADFSISSKGQLQADFADIVKAIHIVQENMGIAGATAMEAGTTIEGSVNSMKAAWSNLVTGIADENADIEVLIRNLVMSIVGDGSDKNLGVLGNVLPAVERAMDGAGQLIEGIMPIIIDKVPTIINEWLPKILNSGISIIRSILDGMVQNQGDIVSGVVTTINTLVNGIMDNLPEILVTGVMLIGQIAAGLIQGLPDLLYRIPEIIVEIWNAFADNADVFLEIGKSIVVGIWEGIKSLWSSLTENFSGLWRSLSMAQNYQITGQIAPVNGSHASGLSYVPFDGYIAKLHKGERVLTADEARGYNSRSNNSGYDERPIKIVVQSVLDGKVIGETAYNYNRRKARAGGT